MNGPRSAVTARPGRRRPGRAKGRGMNGVLWTVAAAAVVGAGVWFVTSDPDETGVPATTPEPGISHVHGLGLEPSDGSLIVATHFGSFRVPADGEGASRIGESYQDTMGFTVAGPERYLGSGHPDVAGRQAGQPTRLGLIESTDAGATWTILSLGDEVDFHALAAAEDRVYGWDASSSRFMVSEDRTEWERLATIDLFGFAVDPADVDHLVGTTPQGLVESTDGGRTWVAADGPALVAVSWAPGAGLWGAASDGAVWRTERGGWRSAGRLPGAPQAFLATDDALYVAVVDGDGVTTIVQSADEAATWDVRYRDAEG